jgi:predicted HAD superfamily Cof-like phosphohydrolase
MNEQKRISDWLLLAGKESSNKPTFPEDNKFQLALSLILEELFEAAESGSDEQYRNFLLSVKRYLDNKIMNYKKREREEGDLIELRDACADLRVVMGNLIHFAGINEQYEKDFNDVMDSNFSKFCTSQDEADKTVEAYANGTHPNKNGEKIKCYHVKVGDYWIVKRVEDGKILKSINFKEVDFK